MAKNKRRATSTVDRRQDTSPANIVSPKGNDHDGDSSGVLAPPVGSDIGPDEVACAPSSAHPSRDVSPAIAAASSSRLLDVVQVEDCSGGSDDETIREDQLDLNFSDEDCDSPQGPEILPAPILTSPMIPSEKVHSFLLPQSDMPPASTSGILESAPPPGAGNLTSGPSTSKWRDILFSNRSTTPAPGLNFFH